MQSIILIGPQDFSLERLINQTVIGAENRYYIDKYHHVIEFLDGYVACHFEPELRNELKNEYEEEELKNVPYQEPVFVSVDYSQPSIIRRLVKQSFFDKDLWIDDDNNPVITAQEFEKRIREMPEWDWRV